MFLGIAYADAFLERSNATELSLSCRANPPVAGGEAFLSWEDLPHHP